MTDEIPGWPQVRLTEPAYAKRFGGPAWEDFPPGLRADIDAHTRVSPSATSAGAGEPRGPVRPRPSPHESAS